MIRTYFNQILGKNVARTILLVVGVVFVLAACAHQPVSAWRGSNGKGSGRNHAEETSWGGNPCGDSRLIPYPCAVFWLSNPGSSYLSEAGSTPDNPIWVDWNATKLRANIRGSWNTQFSSDTHIYSLFSIGGSGRNVRVLNLNGHKDSNGSIFFDRGHRGGHGIWWWINSNDQLELEIDINGVAKPGGPAERVKFRGTSCLARKFGNIVKTYSGESVNCDTEGTNFWLRRRAKPQGWDVNGQTYAVAKSGSGYTSYKNYKNSQPDGWGAINHASDQPTIGSGELARFSSNLRNVELPGYGRQELELKINIKNTFFRNYHEVVNCERQNWNSCGSDTKIVVWRGADPPAKTQCSGQKYRSWDTIFIKPDALSLYSYDDDCLGMRIPSDGSKIGWYVCQKVAWYWNTSVDHVWDNSVPACFVVKSTFDLIPKIGDGSTSIGATNQDTQVDAPSIIQNEGGVLRNIGVDWGTYDFKIPNAVIQSAGGESAVTAIFNQIFNKTSSGSLRYAEVDFGSIVHACEWMKGNPDLHAYVPDCNTLASAIVSALSSGGNQVNNEKLKTTGAQVGDLVCRTMTIRHYNWDTRAGGDTHRRVAYPKCYRIAKKPSVQVWGNGIRVGSNSGVVTGLPATQYTRSSIITAMSSLADSGQLFGSWGEYGMTTPQNGVIRSASAGGLSGVGAGAANASTSTEATRNNLSFANAGIPGGGYGKWGMIPAQPNIGGQFTSNVRNHAGNVSLGGMASGVYNATARVVKISGEVGAGKSIIIKSAGTVIIDGNITYAPSSYHKSSDITQLVIVASNIIIRNNVTQVDAWLAATPNKNNTQDGIVSTCEIDETPNLTAIRARGVNYANGLNANTCNQQLRINGPVLARELQLRRTFGSDRRGAGDVDGYNDPAEIINMRADAYLWAANYISNTTGNITTDYTIELPPRY